MNRSSFALSALLMAGPSVPALWAQVTVGPQVQIDTGRGFQPCNETTISAAKSNPLHLVAGWNDYREGTPRTGVGLSLDGGKTWSDFLLRPPPQFQASVEGDPMTCYDDRTGTLWAGGMSFAGNGGIFVARKDPLASTFQPAVMARISGGVDKGWMAAGPAPGNPNSTRVYCAYNEGCIRSADLGNTWSAPVSLGLGLGFLPRVSPSTGHLYVTYWDTGTGVMLRRSTDGGVSFGPPILIATRMDVWGIDGSRFPGNFRVASLNALAQDPNTGTLYCIYPDTTNIASNGSNVDLYFCKSTDDGLTWSVPVVLNSDATPPGDQFFPWLEVDAQGRLHLTFFDTRNVVQPDSAPFGFIDAYYATSTNQGASWTEIRLTPNSFSSQFDGFNGTFMGDYLGLSTAGHLSMPVYPTTQNGNNDVFVNGVQDGPAIEFCFGIACPCGNDDPDAGCGNLGFDGASATGATLQAAGSNSIAADDLELTVAGLAPASFGLVFTSQGTQNLPFGDGRRCVGTPFFRYLAQAASPSGTIALGPGAVVSYANANFGPSGTLMAGATWDYQAWYRDVPGACGSGFNFSNAVRVAWSP
jgi:hypothetical protein